MSPFILIWILAAVNITFSHMIHKIYVDPVNGKDSELCLHKISTCGSLNYALGGVNHNETTIHLSSGLIELSISNTTLTDLSNFTIVGTGIAATTIQCNDTKAGLFFVRITDLTMANLTITNCGMLQNSTTWNVSSPAQYPSAVTIYNSSNVVIHSVSFEHNNGIGLSIVNTGGLVNIYRSTFDSNYVIDGSYPGGGGLYIEFPFCLPDNFPNSALSENHLNSNSNYNISACYFANNIATKTNLLKSFFRSSTCTKQTFGHGGGMSVFFRGNSTNNTIDIINTEFVNNTAVWGGGLFIEFNHYASGNTVTIKECSQFSNNKCSDDDDNPDITGGGGVQIVYAPYNNLISPHHNGINFSYCNFANNTAYWGGGVSYVTLTEQHATGTNSLYFTNCHWQYNVAKFGAAVDMSLYQSMTSGIVQAVVFENCSFVSNSAVYNVRRDQFELQGVGTVYVSSIAIQLKEKIDFKANNGSALVLSDSYVNITDGCNVMFTDNKGLRGGALSLLASSWMSIGKNTKITFVRNHADEVGGAINAELNNEHNVISEWNCFIQYSDRAIPPDGWHTTIEFQDNNSSHRGHSIYATTIRSCVWGNSYAHVNINDTKDAFHWNCFSFTGTSNLANDNEIATDTTHYSIPPSGTQVTISPGEKHRLHFNQSDDEGNDANAIFYVQSKDTTISSIDRRSVYMHSNIMQVYGKPDTTANITLTSLGSMPSTVILNVTFDYCPPGFIPEDNQTPNNKISCKCANDHTNGIPGIVECNSNLYRAYITRFYWAGYYPIATKDNGANEVFVTSLCPSDYCSYNGSTEYRILLPKNRSELDFCSHQNRNGTICGECMSGYTISSKSTCIKCDHGTAMGILFFILYECLPTLLFIFAILIFNLHITSSNWNSVIFYFQIVGKLNLYALHSAHDYHHKATAIFIKIHQNIYGIWNLEFFQTIKPNTCYIKGMKNVFELNLLKFSALLFPIGLIGILYLFTNCNCSRLVCNKCKQKWDYFAKKWKKWFGGRRGTFLIHGFAAFIVVSYTRIALLSMNFLISTPLYHDHKQVFENRAFLAGTIKYFSTEHAPYILFALFFLSISVILPVYLILKPLKKLCPTQDERDDKCDPPLCCCIGRENRGKCNEFLREFYGPFKHNRQFYAGFFFVYRLAFYATFAFTPTLQIQYCVQQFLLVTMLLIHAVLQPYDTQQQHKQQHQQCRYRYQQHFATIAAICDTSNTNTSNILDALIFFNLNCINALAVYNFYSVIDIQGESDTAIIFQLLFTYLPLLYVLYRFVLWFRKACCTDNGLNDDDDERVPILQNNAPSHNERMEMIRQRLQDDPEGGLEELKDEFQQYSINEDQYDVIN